LGISMRVIQLYLSFSSHLHGWGFRPKSVLWLLSIFLIYVFMPISTEAYTPTRWVLNRPMFVRQ